ncbi:MAG TPA: hypothetical protein VMV69_04875 [Pirellulales bacterium]|nr:hypothetical protein [Pirellulales bacterium]
MKKLAAVWQFSTDDEGHSVIRTWRGPGRRRFRVEVVFEPRAARELVAEFGTRKEAEKLAAWFGRQGSLRAEVTPTAAGRSLATNRA